MVTPIRAASLGLSQSGFEWAISVSHFALPLRVRIRTGSRKVGTRQYSLRARFSFCGATWLGAYVGVAYSGHPQAARVVE